MVELQGTVTRVGGSIPVSWSSAKMDRAKNLFQCQTPTLNDTVLILIACWQKTVVEVTLMIPRKVKGTISVTDM